MEHDLKVTYAEIALGTDGSHFLKTDLGRYIVGRSEQEKEEALERLKNANPHDHEEIIKYQLKAKVAERAVEWIVNAIITGKQSEDNLLSQEGME